MYMFVRGIYFSCFCDFSILFWNCSDSVVFFVLHDFGIVPTVWYFCFAWFWNCSHSVVFIFFSWFWNCSKMWCLFSWFWNCSDSVVIFITIHYCVQEIIILNLLKWIWKQIRKKTEIVTILLPNFKYRNENYFLKLD